MINWRIISKIIGSLLFIEALLMTICLGVAVYFKESDSFAFLVSIISIWFFGFIFRLWGRNANNTLSRKDAYLVVSLSWIVFSFFGTFPFLISGYITNFTDAYFETMSGFSTTGASVIDDVERLPHGLLFWRSFTQWIGGLGIVFFTIAVLPSMVGGSTKVFAAEATGPIRTKLHPRISMSAKWIWMVYLILTISCFGCFMLFGMNWWESINYSMTTTATGGFAIYNSSIATFQSPALECVSTFFCFLSGINFTLLYFSVAKLQVKDLLRNAEFRFYVAIIAISTIFIAWQLIQHNGYDVEHAFRSAVFQTVNFITTTGLFSDDAAKWPHATWVVLAGCMFMGGCSSSTSGAFKCVRGLMILKVIRNEMHQILHPNAVLPLKINKVNVPMQNRVTLLAFLSIYVGILVLVAFAMMLCGIDYTNALTISLSCIGNVGPSLGLEIGPTMSWSMLSDTAKWLCSMMMLVGRLEIFTVLVILTPAFWKKN